MIIILYKNKKLNYIKNKAYFNRLLKFVLFLRLLSRDGIFICVLHHLPGLYL